MPYHVGTSAECPKSKPHAVIKTSDGKLMGCHSSEADAQRQIAAIHASEGAAVTTEVEAFHLPGKHNQKSHGNNTGPKYDRSKPKMAGETLTLAVSSPSVSGDSYGGDTSFSAGTPWEGVLAMEDVETGDGRMFSPGSITWADLPIPLRWNMEDSHGGQPTTKAVLVGRIDKIWRDPENPMKIMGAGVFDDTGANGAEALRLVQGKFLKGVSVDPDDIKDADVELVFPESSDGGDEMDEMMAMFAPPELTIFHAGRLRGATLVDIPAFVEAGIWLVDPATVPQAVTASHFGSISDGPWNGPVNESHLSGQITLQLARRVYAHVEKDAESKTSARFLHHEVSEDGTIGPANLNACTIGIRAINTGRANGISRIEQRLAYEHMAEHMRETGHSPAPFKLDDVLTAAGVGMIEGPPAEWFCATEPDELTALHVSDEVTASGWRRIYGHGAEWGTCHMSFGDGCTKPPREPHGEHVYYRLGEVVTASGERIATGNITLGTGHASTRGLTAQQATEHYDNTGTIVAQVASVEGRHGIWLCGAIPPWVTDERVGQLQASGKVSGDWRRIGGALRLVAMLAVNVPGFPVPRMKTFVSLGRQQSMIAAGIVDIVAQTRATQRASMLNHIARSIGRTPETRMAAIRDRVKGIK